MSKYINKDVLIKLIQVLSSFDAIQLENFTQKQLLRLYEDLLDGKITGESNNSGHLTIDHSNYRHTDIYADTYESVDENPYRKCRLCKCYPTEDGHDFCLGNLPGVKYACCGHGKLDQSYIVFTNDYVVRQCVPDSFEDCTSIKMVEARFKLIECLNKQGKVEHFDYLVRTKNERIEELKNN